MTVLTDVIHKIHKDKWSERMEQFYSKTFRRITPSSVGRLIELNVEAFINNSLRLAAAPAPAPAPAPAAPAAARHFSCALLQLMMRPGWTSVPVDFGEVDFR